jgi:2'-5' RNA ligase
MTVVFLGSLEEPHVARVVDAVGPVVAPAGPLEPRRFLELPKRRPRVLAVEYADPSGRCSALQHAVAEALASAGLVEAERRRWLPHVSIARLKDAPAERPELASLAFTPEALVLYRSHLGHGPARHEALHAWELPRS